jgi:hypothetical protein
VNGCAAVRVFICLSSLHGERPEVAAAKAYEHLFVVSALQ